MEDVVKSITRWAEFEDLNNWRQVCRKWGEVILTIPLVLHWHKVYRDINTILNYNANVYDCYSYERLKVKNDITQNLKSYEKLKLKYVREVENDMDVGPAYCIFDDGFISEFYIFTRVYLHKPSPFIRLYPFQFMNSIILANTYDLYKRLSHFQQIVYFIPLCYSRVHQTKKSDKQYVSIVLYIDVIESDMFTDKRFTKFTIDVDNLYCTTEHYTKLNNLITETQKRISNNDFTVIREMQFMTFTEALLEILK